MNKVELNSAFDNGSKVNHKGVTYKRISALIVRKDSSGKKKLQVELEGMTRGVVIVDPSRVEGVR